MHTIDWLRGHAAEIALVLSVATVVARLLYALVARRLGAHPRLRAAVESLAAWSPDVLRGLVQLYRAVTGVDLPMPLVDARDAEIARLRDALAAAQGDRLTLRPQVPAPIDPQRGAVRPAVLLASVFVVGMLGVASLRCRANLPAVSGCTPYARRCVNGYTELCSGSQRWERDGDVPCARLEQVCVAGACVDPPDAAAGDASADGGAR